MSDSFFSPLRALALSLVLYIAIKLFYFGRREKNLPPGPPTIPILGNAHQILGDNLHIKFKKWGDRYGHVYSLKVGAGTMVVLNSKRAVHDLVDKRGAIYSERPYEQQVVDTTRHENYGVLDASNPVWKAQRKMTVHFLAPTNLDGDIAKIFEAEIDSLMHDLLVSPRDFQKHIKRCTASAAAIVLFGQRAKSNDDFWATGVFKAMEEVNKAVAPGSYPPTEQFPILKLIPRQWFTARKRASDAYDKISSIWAESVTRVEQRRDNGDKRISLLDSILDEEITPDVPMKGSQLPNFFGAIMQAAGDTSAIGILTQLRYLATYPEIQRKARVELDNVCGTGRVPTWADYKNAPYINCIVKEGLRINPVAPVGLPHRLKQDDYYEGMLIPKDATIIISAYSLGRSQYEDGDKYNPDRYLNHPRLAPDYAASPDFENRDHYAYGAGRRICAGIHLAERTQWRILSKLLWGFNIEPDIDEKTGQELEIDPEAYDEGLVPFPKPFSLRITPRSPKHAEVILRGVEDAQEFLKKWE